MRGRAAGRVRERELGARGACRIAGVDEVGRGSLAGPVVAAAVILDPDRPVRGLRDSKLLSRGERERLAARIEERAVAAGIGAADAGEVDSMNILRATLLAMRRAVEALAVSPDYLLVDALHIPGVDLPQEGVVHGDRLVASIAAASILAKVHRDALMRSFHDLYPGYGFGSHMGYGTEGHLVALRRLGSTPLHRVTFRGVPPHSRPAVAAAAPRSG
ncbi:MAG TPA: ribonuclease HII [Candidatus Cryosericum sp.]|nr:ribonuclease HII [Candidatus Cryosericum sp.]